VIEVDGDVHANEGQRLKDRAREDALRNLGLQKPALKTVKRRFCGAGAAVFYLSNFGFGSLARFQVPPLCKGR
jgi:hypothetical protein